MRYESGSIEAARQNAAWKAPRTGGEAEPPVRLEQPKEFALKASDEDLDLDTRGFNERKPNVRLIHKEPIKPSGLELDNTDYRNRPIIKPEIHKPSAPIKKETPGRRTA